MHPWLIFGIFIPELSLSGKLVFQNLAMPFVQFME